MEKSCVKL